MKKSPVPEEFMLLRRGLAFLVDGLLSALLGWLILLPFLTELGDNLAKALAQTTLPRITDLGEVYIAMVLIFGLAFMPFVLLPFRFCYHGKSLGSALMNFRIAITGSKKTAPCLRSAKRSPALLLLSLSSSLQFLNSILLSELYTKGPYEIFLSLHFALALLVVIGLVGLSIEWGLLLIFTLIRGPQWQSWGEKWSGTTVVRDSQ